MTLTALWLLALFLLLYFLKSPALAAKSVKGALDICVSGLIPSLFPFIVLVSIINHSGLSEFFSHILGRPAAWLFGIDRCAVSAVLLGALGGFPIGAVCARELYESRRITSSDAERLLTFTGCASPAFCIGAIGTSMFGDTHFGISLYICQLAAAIIIGIAQRKKTYASSPQPFTVHKIEVTDTVASSIAGGGITMVKICSFAVFFAVIGDALCSAVLHYFGNAFAASCALICELTLAARTCAAYDCTASRLMCAFAVGWSGISVHMQTASVLSGSGISLKRYYICKLLQGIISTALMLGFIY